MEESFRTNPGVNWTLRKGKRGERGRRRMFRWIYTKTKLCNGLQISTNQRGVTVCIPSDVRFRLIHTLHEFWFGITSIPLKKIPGVLKREAYRKRIRTAECKRYLYFWFFGALKNSGRAAWELKDRIFQKSTETGLPVLLETAMEKNKRVYERYGFTTYHHWKDEAQDIEFWFMRRDPDDSPV